MRKSVGTILTHSGRGEQGLARQGAQQRTVEQGVQAGRGGQIRWITEER